MGASGDLARQFGPSAGDYAGETADSQAGGRLVTGSEDERRESRTSAGWGPAFYTPGSRCTSSTNSRGHPMLRTVTAPIKRAADGLAKPDFSATNVAVPVARTQAGPSGSPVSQSR